MLFWVSSSRQVQVRCIQGCLSRGGAGILGLFSLDNSALLWQLSKNDDDPLVLCCFVILVKHPPLIAPVRLAPEGYTKSSEIGSCLDTVLPVSGSLRRWVTTERQNGYRQ